jgi:hypothetical protein
MAHEIKLNREQIAKLIELYSQFEEVQNFTVRTEYDSGIGVGVSVSFDLFERSDTKVDITDYKKW